MSKPKYAELPDEEVIALLRERLGETKRLLSEIRDLLKVR